jgi:putative nucleotidyltransferase with HDIG domain
MGREILLVDDAPEERGQLVGSLHRQCPDWNVSVADSAAFAQDHLDRQSFDAVLADQIMPGPGGVEVLEQVRRRSPGALRVLLISHYNFKTVLPAMEVAHQCVPKPLHLDSLRDTLHRAFRLRDLVADDRLQRRIAQTRSLPHLPRLYPAFLEEARKRQPSLERLSAIVQQDPGLCSKMLQLANSAYFVMPRRIADPGEALVYLGLETVKAIVHGLNVFVLIESNGRDPGWREDLWRHSWRTALIARHLGSLEQLPDQEIGEVTTAGLLHDVGKWILSPGLDPDSDAAIQKAATKNRAQWRAETDVLGVSHAEVGACLLATWGLPDPIVEAVAFHHQPAAAPASNGNLALFVNVASHLAHITQDNSCGDIPSSIDLEHLERVQLKHRLKIWKAAARDCRLD